MHGEFPCTFLSGDCLLMMFNFAARGGRFVHEDEEVRQQRNTEQHLHPKRVVGLIQGVLL